MCRAPPGLLETAPGMAVTLRKRPQGGLPHQGSQQSPLPAAGDSGHRLQTLLVTTGGLLALSGWRSGCSSAPTGHRMPITESSGPNVSPLGARPAQTHVSYCTNLLKMPCTGRSHQKLDGTLEAVGGPVTPSSKGRHQGEEEAPRVGPQPKSACSMPAPVPHTRCSKTTHPAPGGPARVSWSL